MKQILVEMKKDAAAASQTEEIRQEWEKGIYDSLLIHIYSGLSEDRYTSQIACALQACFPDARIVGTMSAGEILNGRLMQKGILISAMLFEENAESAPIWRRSPKSGVPSCCSPGQN